METLKRQSDIIELLKTKKHMTVIELAEALYIGAASIRRDLVKLEKLGYVKRTHGGVTLISGLDSEIPLYVREETMTDEKKIIAKFALKLIKNRDILVLDSSSTTYQLAQLLHGSLNARIVTNGAKTAILLGEKNIPVFSTGGQLREFSYSFIGDMAKAFLQNFHCNTLFFSCRYVSSDFVLYDSSEHEAELRKAMIQICDKVVLLCDSSKINGKSFYKICDCSKIDYLVTDKKPPEKILSGITDMGCNVIYDETI